ncbi:MAG: hypothetical protein EU535_08640 [Promethearchaeota archaeon]|nr:MAG: hypothetical protein EU535_08640 [Candidatus Lokiarchaeota archaeon]
MSEEFNFWMGMIKKYWYALAILAIAVVGVVVGAILVLMRYISAPDIAGGGTWTLDQFSLGSVLLWIIFLVLWELLLVVLPFIAFCGIVVAIFWYGILSEEDRTAIKERERREKHPKRTNQGGGAAGFIFFLAFLCLVAIEGNFWTVAGDLSYSYYIFAYLRGIMWTCIVLGIPALIVGIIFLSKKWRTLPGSPVAPETPESTI